MVLTSTINTALEYMYRDASNYKWFNTIIVKGALRIEDIENYLIDGEFFVPQEIGLDSLTPVPRNEDDHDWHEVFSLTSTTKPANSGSASELIDRFRKQYEKIWKNF